MLVHALSLAVSTFVFVAGISPTAGQGRAQDFLTPAQVVKVLMDGLPWSAETANGRRAKITFNKDGTGLFEGPMTMSTSWEIKGQDVCLNLRMAGVKCLRFRQVAGGFEGYLGQTLDLKLTR